MMTFGGIIEEEEFDIKKLNLNDFDFIKNEEEPYRIKIPNITLKEVEFVNSNINDKEYILKSKILTEEDFDKYKNTYKYLPYYMDVRY